MDLTITLTQQEYNDIFGWVKYYGEHKDQTPTKIVLSDRSWARYDQIAAQFNYVPPSDALTDFKQRLKVGQNCAWNMVTDAEATALKQMFDPNRVLQYTQFYGASGGGGMNVSEREAKPGGVSGNYEYVSIQNGGNWTPDVNGAADTYVAWLCQQQGHAPPPPVWPVF